MTATTTVLSILVDTTVPSRTLRRFGRPVSCAVASVVGVVSVIPSHRPGSFGGGDLFFPEDREDPGDVPLHRPQPGRVVELPGHDLEPQVEHLLLGLG